MSRKKIRLGDLLVQQEIITEEQLQQALKEQKSSGRRLGQTLVDLKLVEEDELLGMLSQQLRVPFVRLANFQFDNEVVHRLPETVARRYRAIALSDNQDGLLVGMSDPMDIFAYDELVKILKRPFQQAVIRESELLQSLDVVYGNKSEISQFAEELEGELSNDAFDLANLGDTTNEEAPVVRLLQSVFEDAVTARASDIHIEPDETVLRIRQRVDGQLHEQIIKEKRISAALVLRLKLMCGLNISEKRIPQDGRFSFLIKGKPIDVRLSTMPVQYGESVVMRLLNQSEGLLDLNASGMPADILQRFRHLIKRPHGIVLVTGPTGSGKTTTLYGALNEVNQPDTKIITAEDPIEYRLPRLTQVQINTKINLDFATVLRAALRQDPDIILVGEMRDVETAEIGLRAAMTGHLVLSTLHTNDAVASATRLIDMGMEPYLVASALLGIVAQRLVRKVCSNCKTEYEPTIQEKVWLEHLAGHSDGEFYVGGGCYQCSNTGYKGRLGVFELLEFDEFMLESLRNNDQNRFAQLVRASDRFRSLGQCALDLALNGGTSLEEVFRVSTDLPVDADQAVAAAAMIPGSENSVTPTVPM
jgi:MSHA biogenesis protein MshE